MLIKERNLDRERIAGAIIIITLLVILLSMIAIWLMDVKVSNIELVDRGLYTVITDNGPINVGEEDILRIERTYAKAAITGTPVEIDKVYTTKGFIYFSSLDPFYKTGHMLINSVDFEGKPIWILANSSGSDVTLDQRINANLRLIQPFSYAIGTSSKLAIVIFSILSLQYLAFSLGGIALLILIFPLRLGRKSPDHRRALSDMDFCLDEEQIDAVAK